MMRAMMPFIYCYLLIILGCQKLLIDMTKTIMRGWVWRYGAHQEFPWLWGEFVRKVAGINKNMSSFGF